MSLETLNSLLSWLSAHPVITGVVIFLVAFSESLVVVGIIVPGAAVMIGFGALIATGYLDFWPTTILAILGAVAGDGLSYWLGKKYQRQLFNLWPLSRHPELFDRSVRFFDRHGGKSVFLGRFVGPLRALVPAVAGMSHMPLSRFAFTNVLSAIGWAPLYLLPGIAFGLSLELATEVAGRLAILIVVLLVLFLILIWIIRHTYAWLAPQTDALLFRLLMWSRRHPLIGKLPISIASPDQPEMRGLTLLAILLLITTAGFLLLSQAVLGDTMLGGMDKLLHGALQALRSPPIDSLMVLATSLGDAVLLLIIVIITALWLGWQRHWLALWHCLAAFLFPALLVQLLKLSFDLPRPPTAMLPTDLHTFPSGHATLAMTVYGFLAVLITRDLVPRYRTSVYTIAGILIMAIGFSRVYLGAHWSTDVIAGLTLGLAWVAFLGIAYRRHEKLAQIPAKKTLLLGLALAFVMIAYPIAKYDQHKQTYAPHYETQILDASSWWQTDWQTLPLYRGDLRKQNNHPLTIQWTGTLTSLSQHLYRHGWQQPEYSTAKLLQWLNPNPDLKKLPLLPQVHEGQYETLRLIKYEKQLDRILVLRLWPTHKKIQKNKTLLPLWVGNVSYLSATKTVGVTFLSTEQAFTQPLTQFRKDIEGLDSVLREGNTAELDKQQRDGRVLLLRRQK